MKNDWTYNGLKIKSSRLVLNLLIVVSFALISLLSYFILLRTRTLFSAMDLQFHVRRLTELDQSVQHGKWLPQLGFNYFHGALDLGMYPYLMLYPILLIYHLVKFKLMAIYLFFILNTFAGLLISFYSSYSFCRFRATSYLFALIYNLAGFFLAFNFINMDLGAVSAYTFFPLAFSGMLEFLRKKHWLELSSGMSLLIFSHVLSTVIMGALLMVLFLLNISQLKLRHWFNLLKAVVLTLCITSGFWIPLTVAEVENHGNLTLPTPLQLAGYNSYFFFQAFNLYPNYYSLSLFAILAIVLALFYYQKFDRLLKQLYIIAIIMIIGCSKLMPWTLITRGLPFLNDFQRLNRFYAVPELILTFIFSLIVTKYIRQSKKALLIFAVLAVLFQVQGQSMMVARFSHYPNLTYRYLSRHPYDYLGNSQRYKLIHNYQLHLLTNWVSFKNDYFPVKFTNDSRLRKLIHTNRIQADHHLFTLRRIGYNHFSFSSRYQLRNVKLPFVMYHNERVQVLVNGRPSKIVNDQGQMMISDLGRGHHSIRIKSYPRPIVMWSKILLSGMGLIIYLLIIYRKQTNILKKRR